MDSPTDKRGHPLLQIWTRLTITREHMTAKPKVNVDVFYSLIEIRLQQHDEKSYNRCTEMGNSLSSLLFGKLIIF